MTLAARLDMDENLRQAITNEENGLMKVGALPKVSVASTSGNKALMEAIGDKASCLCQCLCEPLPKLGLDLFIRGANLPRLYSFMEQISHQQF